jgi:PEGA domain-containing protein
MIKNLRRFIFLLFLIVPSLAASATPAQGGEGDQPNPGTSTRADAAAKKRDDKATKKRGEQDQKREQTAKRRADADKNDQEAAKRRAEGDNDRDKRTRGDEDRRRPLAVPRPFSNPAQPARVVFVGGYFYDPYFGPRPWWSPIVYPYRWSPRFDGRAHVRLLVSPKHTAVYVDGFYAGIVDDFDGIFQPLPLLPGGHTLTLYLDGYRTVNRSVYLAPDRTLRLSEEMERLPVGMASVPPIVSPTLPPPPLGTYIPPRTPPREQPPAPVLQADVTAPGFGVLSLRFQPPSADVTIDGEQWLTTSPGELVLYIAAGRHVVSIGGRERAHFSTEVDVREGETTELNVSVPRTTH